MARGWLDLRWVVLLELLLRGFVGIGVVDRVGLAIGRLAAALSVIVLSIPASSRI